MIKGGSVKGGRNIAATTPFPTSSRRTSSRTCSGSVIRRWRTRLGSGTTGRSSPPPPFTSLTGSAPPAGSSCR